uniref:Glycine rich superfamily member n=1 Tax=Rhipicephalus appendiculatus TaxID=34631 RepID=A0A131Z7G6_RHIAP
MPENFGRVNGFSNTGSGMSIVPWSTPGGVYTVTGAGYGSTGYTASFRNMPGAQPFGGVGDYSGRRFPSDVGIYDDDIFFQE